MQKTNYLHFSIKDELKIIWDLSLLNDGVFTNVRFLDLSLWVNNIFIKRIASYIF